MHDLGPKQLPDAYMECGSQPANITMYTVAKDIPAPNQDPSSRGLDGLAHQDAFCPRAVLRLAILVRRSRTDGDYPKARADLR